VKENGVIIGSYLILLVCFSVFKSEAAEYSAHGIVDVRISNVDSLATSYLVGGQGKFASEDGLQFSLAQLGTDLSIKWDNGISAHGVVNAYLKGTGKSETSVVNFTEAYLKYRGLPTASGYRFQTKVGIFYPEISLENNAYAWASKDTLNSSMLNTWIGEEIRVLGSEFKLTRLGRMNNDAFDLSFSATAFVNNDPAGALLAWHGWTSSTRQTLWTEKRPISWFPALEEGQPLENQARASDPFLEVDDRVGYHLRGEWSLHRKGQFSLGYYDNRAIPYKVIKGQYGWRTRFFHFETRWRLSKELSLLAQYLSGDTLMQSAPGEDVVNNDYDSAFISLTYNWQKLIGNKKHKSTIRIENFSVKDNDNIWGDNNNEDGHSLTFNHNYRLAKQWFLSAELNYIDSHRPAREYTNQSINLVEKQLQLAARYFF
jgi:hypothetical protein